MSGSIVSIQLCVGHRDPMKSVESARMIENYGIEGDRHAVSEGIRTKRQVPVDRRRDPRQVRPVSRRHS